MLKKKKKLDEKFNEGWCKLYLVGFYFKFLFLWILY